MKILLPLALSVLLNFDIGSSLHAQCAGGTLPYTLKYDTMVTGNGNTSRNFTFPKFDPSLGTLLSADLQSVVRLSYSYTLENQDTISHLYKTKIVRTDDISGDALDPDPISAVNQTPQVLSVIPAGQHIDYGPKQMNYTVSNSITDGRLINFLGVGTVNFDYETGTSASVNAPLPYGLSFASASDTMVFSVTYRYCAAALLSSDLLFFTAVSQYENNVLLNWRQATIQTDKTYTIQISTNGITFTNIANVPENAAGNYNYNYLNSSGAGKLFFRIEEKNASGEIKFSNIRTIEFNQNTKGQVSIFPTLYTGGNLQVNFPVKSNWHIAIYASDGRKISESRQQDVYTVQLTMPGSMGNGVYVVETINTKTRQRQINRIIIQH